MFDDLSNFKFSRNLFCSDGSELVLLATNPKHPNGFTPAVLIRKWSDDDYDIIYTGIYCNALHRMNAIWAEVQDSMY